MVPVKFEKPPVTYTSTGVISVRPEDILQSSTGQAQIRRAAQIARELGLPGPGLPPERPEPSAGGEPGP